MKADHALENHARHAHALLRVTAFIPNQSPRSILLWLASRVGLTCLLGLLLIPGTGCRLARSAAELPAQTVRAVAPGAAPAPAVDPVQVQQRLMRFGDEFSKRLFLGIDQLRRGNEPLAAAEVLRFKIAMGSETWSIVCGPNAVANLLDMTTFVTAARFTLEAYTQPELYGDSAQPLLEVCRQSETNVWQMSDAVLKPEQQVELRDWVAAWCRQNPSLEGDLTLRALRFGSVTDVATRPDRPRSGSVFSLLKLDPLSGLDPATRELAETRMFAERALYLTQKLPLLLRWQTELLSLNALQMPAVQQLVTNSTQLTASVDRVSRAAERLPQQISQEREAILQALEAQEQKLAQLANEIHGALTAGTQMSTSLNTTLITFDALMKRFGVGEESPSGPPSTNGEPFRIRDYAETAARLEAAALRLTALLETFDRTLGSTNLAMLGTQMGPVVQQARTSGKEVVDYAFWRAVFLVGVVFMAALVYRWAGKRRQSE